MRIKRGSRQRPRSKLLLVTLSLLLATVGLGAPAAHGAGTGTISVDQMSYTPGETLTAKYTASQASSTHWIGIYKDSVTPAAGSPSIVWKYASEAKGSVELATDELTTGGYNIHLLADDGYTPLATKHFWATTEPEAKAQHSVVCTSQTHYGQGQKFSVSYATTKPSSTNWVGIYPETETPDGSPGSLTWQNAPDGSGTLLFDEALPAGTYKAHFLAEGGYGKLIDPATFVVGSGASSMSQNLIVNGDAECANGSTTGQDAVTLPGWQLSGGPTAIKYGIAGGFLGTGVPGPQVRGRQYFSGGSAHASKVIQTVDVSGAASQIDGTGATYNLSGWLGGYTWYTATAAVKITFQNGSEETVGTAAQIGPVTAADRGEASKLLEKSKTGSIPTGTRKIKVEVLMPGDSGGVIGLNHWNMGAADNVSLTVSAPSLTPADLKPPPSRVPQLDHVFFVMMENKNYGDIIGNSAAPHINAMANSHVILGNSNGAVHPSDPNYWTIAGGSIFGRADNPFPRAQGTFDAPHIGDRVEAASKTWRAYGQSAQYPCDIRRRELATKGTYYDPDNLPFLFFKNMKSTERCEEKLQPLSQLDQDLASVSTTPNFVWFEPNSCNSMHDGPCRNPSSGPDEWVKATTDKIFASPAWTQKKSLLVFTYDEDWFAGTQRIPTIVAGSPGLTKTGFTSQKHATHYSIGRTIEDGLGLEPLTQNDQFALPLNDIWK